MELEKSESLERSEQLLAWGETDEELTSTSEL